MNHLALFFVVLCAASAVMGQRCPGSDFFPDQRGCCPVVINSVPFYADAQGCFPRFIGGVAFYADAGGCYPNSAGVYRNAGAVCPADRVCEPNCPDMENIVAEQQGGARLCANGFYSDVNGCCPRVLVDNQPSYRDAQGCYPISIASVIFYADVGRCYPNSSGVYRPAGQVCPAAQQCVVSCDRNYA